jgi:uncharacterized protein (DUF1015 family)
MDYNRVVKDLRGMTKEKFLESVGKLFHITKSSAAVHPQKKGDFGLYMVYSLIAGSM